MAFSDYSDTTAALLLVRKERERQEQLVLDGKIPMTCASKECSDLFALAVLMEEVGEVAQELQSEVNKRALREELAQVAAVATAWIEKLL